MSNYSTLKGHIDNAIYQNDTQDISGTDMNSILKEIVDSFGAGYLYMGVATPSTDPSTPDQNVFYIAGTEGTYTNFGGITVANEVAVLKYNGAWSKQNTGIKFVSVSQNTSTGHTDITIGDTTTPVASVEDVSQLGQRIGQTYSKSSTLVVSSSPQSIRVDFDMAKKGRFKLYFSGGSQSSFACKVFLYKDSTAAGNLVWESERFGFNKWVKYEGGEFSIAVFSIAGGMVVTEGEATAIVELGIISDISRLDDEIVAGASSRFALMVQTHGYVLSGSPVFDDNGLIIQSGVRWADGSAGTLRKTNFNENVLEYAVETVTHAERSQTVQYSYQFSELGEITKETINIS